VLLYCIHCTTQNPLAAHEFYSDPFEDADDVELRARWFERSRVRAGPFLAGGKAPSSTSTASAVPSATSSAGLSRQDLPRVLQRLRALLREDWAEAETSVYADEDGYVVLEFDMNTCPSRRSVLAYMNIVTGANPIVSEHGLRKVPQLWGYLPKNNNNNSNAGGEAQSGSQQQQQQSQQTADGKQDGALTDSSGEQQQPGGQGGDGGKDLNKMYFAFRPPWLAQAPLEAYYTLHPEKRSFRADQAHQRRTAAEAQARDEEAARQHLARQHAVHQQQQQGTFAQLMSPQPPQQQQPSSLGARGARGSGGGGALGTVSSSGAQPSAVPLSQYDSPYSFEAAGPGTLAYGARSSLAVTPTNSARAGPLGPMGAAMGTAGTTGALYASAGTGAASYNTGYSASVEDGEERYHGAGAAPLGFVRGDQFVVDAQQQQLMQQQQQQQQQHGKSASYTQGYGAHAYGSQGYGSQGQSNRSSLGQTQMQMMQTQASQPAYYQQQQQQQQQPQALARPG